MLYDIIASVKNKRILNRKKHVYEKNLLNDNRAVRKYNMEVAVLKKLVTVLGAFFAVLLACPLSVFAAEGSKHHLQYLYGFAFPLQGFCYVLQ